MSSLPLRLTFAALALVLGACIDVQEGAARKKRFQVWMPGAAVIPDGETITIVSRQAGVGKVRLGQDCLGNQSELDLWIMVTGGGVVADMAANGIPGKASRLLDSAVVKECIADDGSLWRQYSGKLE